MLQATIKCPKCEHPLFQEFGGIYKCLYMPCSELFTLPELVHHWGFDAADFYGRVMATNFPEPVADIHFDYVSLEPLWMNESERIHAYELVNEMLYGVPYIDDYIDLVSTRECCK